MDTPSLVATLNEQFPISTGIRFLESARNLAQNVAISNYDPTEPLTVPFNSSAIASGSYNPVTLTLELNFTDGTSYEYSGVGVFTWTAMQTASSVGQFFNYNIRDLYSYTAL